MKYWLFSLFSSMLQAAFLSFALGLLVSIATIVGEIIMVCRELKNTESKIRNTLSSSKTKEPHWQDYQSVKWENIINYIKMVPEQILSQHC